MGCALVDSLSTATFSNVCILSNVGSNATIQTALQTCCGSSNVKTVNDGCYTFCNVTTTSDEIAWGICLRDNLSEDILVALDGDCFDNFSDNFLSRTHGASASHPPYSGLIATTWTVPYITETILSGGSAYTTVTFPGKTHTFSKTGTRTKTTTLDSSGSTVASASSTTTAPGSSVATTSSQSGTVSTTSSQSGISSTFSSTSTTSPQPATNSAKRKALPSGALVLAGIAWLGLLS